MKSLINYLKEWAKKLKTEIGALIVVCQRRDVSFLPKLLALLTVCYALSPIDLIPDFIPILGYLDDLILLPLGIYLVIKMIPRDIMEECREKARKGEIIKNHYDVFGTIMVVCIWGAIVMLIASALIGK